MQPRDMFGRRLLQPVRADSWNKVVSGIDSVALVCVLRVVQRPRDVANPMLQPSGDPDGNGFLRPPAMYGA